MHVDKPFFAVDRFLCGIFKNYLKVNLMATNFLTYEFFLKGLLTRHLHGIWKLFDFALQLEEICTNLLCSLLQRFDTTLIICYIAGRCMKLTRTFMRGCLTKSYCLAGTDSKLKGIEQALEEVQVSRLNIILLMMVKINWVFVKKG